jgi:hypothetical protein
MYGKWFVGNYNFVFKATQTALHPDIGLSVDIVHKP